MSRAIVTAAATLLASLGAGGCVSSSYLPHVQPNRASMVIYENRYEFYVHRPAIRALSLKPPFACDVATRRLALEGPGPLAEAPEPLERFSGPYARYGRGVYAVSTVDGPELRPGPVVVVLTGEDLDHPALSLMNLIDRYNDVAECLERGP